MKVKLSLVDVAKEFRQAFGPRAEELELLGHPVPEHDWCWRIEYGAGGEYTFGYQETAAQVHQAMVENGWEL